MKASELKGRAVVTLSDAAKVGHVDDVFFDAEYRRVVGFRLKRGVFAQAEALARDGVTAIGPDALTVPSPEVINDQGRFAGMVGAATLDEMQGTKVVSEGGTLVGTIDDVEVDEDVRTVTAYVLSVGLWDRLRHGGHTIGAHEMLRLGEGGIMIVPNAVAESVQRAKTQA